MAYKLTLYAMTVPLTGSGSAESLTITGRAVTHLVSSKKVGEVSVSFSNASSISGNASTDLADLTETAYGLQLLTLLRMYSCSVYVS